MSAQAWAMFFFGVAVILALAGMWFDPDDRDEDD